MENSDSRLVRISVAKSDAGVKRGKLGWKGASGQPFTGIVTRISDASYPDRSLPNRFCRHSRPHIAEAPEALLHHWRLDGERLAAALQDEALTHFDSLRHLVDFNRFTRRWLQQQPLYWRNRQASPKRHSTRLLCAGLQCLGTLPAVKAWADRLAESGELPDAVAVPLDSPTGACFSQSDADPVARLCIAYAFARHGVNVHFVRRGHNRPGMELASLPR